MVIKGIKMIQDSDKQKLELEIKSTSSGQKIEYSGRIHVPKKAWILRITTISILGGIIFFNVVESIRVNDFFLLYLSMVLVDAFLIVLVGWLFYKNPSTGIAGNNLVSVLVPVYNQKK